MSCYKLIFCSLTLTSLTALVSGLSAVNLWPLNFSPLKTSDTKLQWMYMPDDDGIPHLAILNNYGPKYDGNIIEDVQFRLYTRSNRDEYFRLYVNNAVSTFNPNHPTKMIVHGFTSSADSSLVIENKNVYLDKGDYNIIGVDWSVLCPAPIYGTACENAKYAGEYTAVLIDYLVEQTGAKYESFHIIGHSLGAQLAGFAGSVTKGKIRRITALDAAYPLFGNANDTGRLDPSDALLVDAIHTCGGMLGFDDPIGHVDFYPNGGIRPQPGCGTDLIGGCSHYESTVFFSRSLKEPEAYPAKECLTLEEAESGQCTGTATAMMGESVFFEKYGLYYLDTTA